MIRTLIVNDNPGFLKRVRDLLATDEQLEVIAEASDGEEAVSKALDLKPDLILMDVRMGGKNGLTATQRIKDENPEVAIIILSNYDLHEYREAAKTRGANGYVVKINMVEELLPTIQQVLNDQSDLAA